MGLAIGHGDKGIGRKGKGLQTTVNHKKDPRGSLGWRVGISRFHNFTKIRVSRKIYPLNYFMLARVSWTAIQKKIAVNGVLANKMAVVVVLPSSGCPDDNSKTQPTAAIAAIQERSRRIPLLGVTENLPPI